MALAGAREKYLPPYLREPQKPPAPEPAPAPRQQVRPLKLQGCSVFLLPSQALPGCDACAAGRRAGRRALE